MNRLGPTVAGVDVGGERKGFHAVAFRDGAYLDRFASSEAAQIVAWCRDIGALVVGVDAPCRWSATGRARTVERALMGKGIWCFSTPSFSTAQFHPKKYFHWMLAGAELFRLLESTHPLFDGKRRGGTASFETFPHAVVCALAGGIVAARPKGSTRRQVLCRHGYDVSNLPNIDFVDAALCALTGEAFVNDRWECSGDEREGFIVVPALSTTGKDSLLQQA